ncbi:hypothetical protein I6A84_08795 [Frankia sp. CNm7]|uniref:Uncharacterized protein n=1 Tax=Frankia nepalensis TaxID=1836974 RepID=A0A937R9W6_9ACTN|nr:hypothetical protein [Frankia nepalensis]MBL7494861.1 hypothetical protein [Frankia nepalensis]MBL7512215.1 hypothetical protein [Frankia nepalensis]MBL7518208.1 hypothetical protein [Frankia nepalensis]MBL7626570.1 hypothetical protein [Frankia nepalensis]
MTAADEPTHPHETDAVRRWLTEQLARAPEPTDTMAAIIVHVLASMIVTTPRDEPPEPHSTTENSPGPPSTDDHP